MKLKNGGMLLLTAFIWGTAFVAQSVGMDYLGPFSFNGIRCLIGAVALLPCIWFLNRMNKDTETDCSEKEKSAGKAGFITAFYIVIVPVLGIFLHKKIKWKVWMAVLLALVGLYFLCITESFSIGKGDILVFLCALVFSVHILVIDHFSPKVDGVKMSCIQFFVSGILSLPFMFVLETPRLVAVAAAWMPLLYAGVLSCGVAYTLQILGQKNVNPAVASLILSLESCFSVLAGWIILGERLSFRESLGCILMFLAIILAQLPDKK